MLLNIHEAASCLSFVVYVKKQKKQPKLICLDDSFIHFLLLSLYIRHSEITEQKISNLFHKRLVFVFVYSFELHHLS